MRVLPSSPLKPIVSPAFMFLLLLFAVTFAPMFLCFPAVAQQSPSAALAPRRPLITEALDESRVKVLTGNTHPLARREFDLGTAPATLPMERMLLVLKRSPEQETALRKLLDDQQDKHSPHYHKWLTPEQFGAQFGPSDADMQTITSWLQSHGFQVGTTKGRSVLEFSGSASQVQEAFHTSIHKYIVNGKQHWANASDPSIPTALAPAVAGVMTLHNFLAKPTSHFAKEPVLAQVVETEHNKRQVTFPGQNGQAAIHALAPQDFATIYNITPAYNTLSGAGVTIGVVARNNLYSGGQDVANFQNEIGFGNNTFGGSGPFIILNGPDPGNAGGGELAEATLDATWASSIASNASVDFVVSGTTNTTDGVDLSELYIVETNLTDIMTESFGNCEYYSTDARLQGISALAQQAAAQGITYFVSSGDNGAEGCDDPGNPPARGPLSVSALASTAFNVAVGGTVFNENSNPSKYWTSAAPIAESAISYIPENVWNESSPTSGLWSGSGGASAGNLGDNLITPAGTTPGVPKPSWQAGTGLNIPQDGVRDLPDVSLTAAIHDPYLMCFEASCVPDSQNRIYVYFAAGTSASAPSMASIMALVDQSAGGRQGQANYVFYQLAAAQVAAGIYPGNCNGSNTSAPPASNCIFNDITVGNNVVPGETGTSYQAGAGYDLTTGLGSVNVSNLLKNWSSVTFRATATTLTLTPTTITHGEAVTVNAAVTANSGTPTGDVVLLVDTGPVGSSRTVDFFPLNSSGQVSASSNSVPAGVNGSLTTVWAHYAGDGTYAPSDSAQFQITVNPEPSTTSLSLQATDLTGRPVSSPFPFASLVFVRADVRGQSGYGTPTGSVTFTDTCGGAAPCALPSSNPQMTPPVQVLSSPPLNSQGNTSIGDGIISFDAGTHAISGAYNGDTSFNASSSAPITFTIQPGFAGVYGPTDVSVTAGRAGTTSIGIIASSNFTTAITFTCSGLPAEATCSPAAATGQGPSTVVNTNINITTTAAHTTMLRWNERQRNYYAALLCGLPLVGLFVIGGLRRRGWSTFVGLTMLMVFLIFTPACGGGGNSSSHHQQDPGTPAGSYTVTVTAAAGSLMQQGNFTLIVK